MQLSLLSIRQHRQSGSSLIEVLVAVLVLSFGMLALGGMMSYAVQLPKLAGYRSSATSIAAGFVDRMRANVKGFADGSYQTAATSYNATLPADSFCVYPNCQPADIATRDKYQTNVSIRNALPGGSVNAGVGPGMTVVCDGQCIDRRGKLWVIWDEPNAVAALNNASSDECPPGLTGAVQGKPPRCLLVRFSL